MNKFKKIVIRLRQSILNKMRVVLYGTFKIKSCSPEEKCFAYVDTITIEKEDEEGYSLYDSIQFQYPKDYRNLLIRERSGLYEDESYGEPYERPPSMKDIKLLLVASNFFYRWFFMHLIVGKIRLGRKR